MICSNCGTENEAGRKFCDACGTSLAHFAGQTGFRLIAEGVERQAEADVLPSLGVKLAQGYLFGRPEPQYAVES